MIKYTQGDLLKATEPMIVHGCNAQGVMGKGVAKLIRNKWPRAYEEYRKAYDAAGLRPGEVIFADVGGKIIANAITQDDYRRDPDEPTVHADYDAIGFCFADIASRCAHIYNFKEIAIPKIGAGLAGGDWDKIEHVIDRHTPGITVNVYWL